MNMLLLDVVLLTSRDAVVTAAFTVVIVCMNYYDKGFFAKMPKITISRLYVRFRNLLSMGEVY